MSMRCETVKVIREGIETVINKEDLQKGEKVVGEKKAPKKKTSKDSE